MKCEKTCQKEKCKEYDPYVLPDNNEIGYCTVSGELKIHECCTCSKNCKPHTNIIEKLMEDERNV